MSDDQEKELVAALHRLIARWDGCDDCTDAIQHIKALLARIAS